MSITVLIPTPLRGLTNDQETVVASGATVAELIEDMEKNFPGILERLCDEDGEIRRFVNIYHNQEDIRFKQGKDTPVADGDELSVVPAIAGGSS